MSYILDALKKSEQERGHGNVPGVQTVHTSSLSYKDKKAYWPYILITLVALNLIAVAYFIIDKDGDEHDDTVKSSAELPVTARQAADPAGSNDTGKDDVRRNTIMTLPVSAAANQTTEAGSIDPTDTEAADTAASGYTGSETGTGRQQPAVPLTQQTYNPLADNRDNVIPYHELDDSIKQQLPAIIVSAHVYSSNPQQRSIVINNNFLEEGEYIIDGLVLHEITPKGAILDYNGILFSSDVVSGWQ